MENRIISITEKIPQKASLPDGYYNGTWGGSIIEVHYQGRIFELETQEGIRDIDIKVVVEVKNGIATFTKALPRPGYAQTPTGRIIVFS